MTIMFSIPSSKALVATTETNQTFKTLHFSKNTPIKTNLFKKPNLVLNYFDRP